MDRLQNLNDYRARRRNLMFLILSDCNFNYQISERMFNKLYPDELNATAIVFKR